jgi:hypothetical protein
LESSYILGEKGTRQRKTSSETLTRCCTNSPIASELSDELSIKRMNNELSDELSIKRMNNELSDELSIKRMNNELSDELSIKRMNNVR